MVKYLILGHDVPQVKYAQKEEKVEEETEKEKALLICFVFGSFRRRVPRSVLARHYTDFSPERVKQI